MITRRRKKSKSILKISIILALASAVPKTILEQYKEYGNKAIDPDGNIEIDEKLLIKVMNETEKSVNYALVNYPGIDVNNGSNDDLLLMAIILRRIQNKFAREDMTFQPLIFAAACLTALDDYKTYTRKKSIQNQLITKVEEKLTEIFHITKHDTSDKLYEEGVSMGRDWVNLIDNDLKKERWY